MKARIGIRPQSGLRAALLGAVLGVVGVMSAPLSAVASKQATFRIQRPNAGDLTLTTVTFKVRAKPGHSLPHPLHLQVVPSSTAALPSSIVVVGGVKQAKGTSRRVKGVLLVTEINRKTSATTAYAAGVSNTGDAFGISDSDPHVKLSGVKELQQPNLVGAASAHGTASQAICIPAIANPGTFYINPVLLFGPMGFFVPGTPTPAQVVQSAANLACGKATQQDGYYLNWAVGGSSTQAQPTCNASGMLNWQGDMMRVGIYGSCNRAFKGAALWAGMNVHFTNCDNPPGGTCMVTNYNGGTNNSVYFAFNPAVMSFPTTGVELDQPGTSNIQFTFDYTFTAGQDIQYQFAPH